MIKMPNMLIIGASGRNVGKTEFACELIKQEAIKKPVIGLKVTAIKEKDGKCPRGGKGCGVCTSLEGKYLLTEENSGPEDKDTARMLRAGAEKVYWLRVLREHLQEGIEEFFKLVNEDACIVCESNSLRRVVEPGQFIIIKEKSCEEIKHSCKKVIAFADKIINFDGSGWDFPPEKISFTEGKWQ